MTERYGYLEMAREAAKDAAARLEKMVAAAGHAMDTLLSESARLPRSLKRDAVRAGVIFVGLTGLAEGAARAQSIEPSAMGIGARERTAVIEQKLEALYKVERILAGQVSHLEQAMATDAVDEDFTMAEEWSEKETEGRYKLKKAQLEGLQTRIERLETRQQKLGAKWAEKREESLERKKGKGKEVTTVINIAERANNETDALLASWDITVRGNQLIIPNGDGTYQYVTAGPEFIDIGFLHSGPDLKVVFETTSHDYNTIDIQHDKKTGTMFEGMYISDEQGRRLNAE